MSDCLVRADKPCGMCAVCNLRAERDALAVMVGEMREEVGIARWAMAAMIPFDEAARDWKTASEQAKREYLHSLPTMDQAAKIAEARKRFVDAVRNGAGRGCYQCAKNSDHRAEEMAREDESEREYDRVDSELKALESSQS